MPHLRTFLLGLMAAAGLAASTPSHAQGGPGSWKANEDDSLLFEARLGRYQLGDGVRGYQTPDAVCVDLGDVVRSLDIAVEIDQAKETAEGWAFEERNQLKIDRRAGKVRVANRQFDLKPTSIRDTPEGWCVSTGDLASWLDLQFVPDLANSILVIKSKTKLPVELAEERRARAARIRPAEKLDLSKLPQVKLPYRFWRTPSLDAVVTVGGLSDKRQGKRVDRQWELYASGEIADMSFDARLSSNLSGKPHDFRMRAYRSDVSANLLGPLRATHYEIGDVSSYASPLVSQSVIGRGAAITNRPLDLPDTFDRKTFRGELPRGWDAELYRNGQLLAIAQDRADGRYEFVDVPLLFGQNQIEIVLYGPQGQVRRERQTLAVGSGSIPPRQTWYWASVSQDYTSMIRLHDNVQALGRGWRGDLGVERGLDQRTSIAAQVHSLVLDDERLTYVEGAVRRSIGFALVEVGGAYQTGGGVAGHAQISAQVGNTNIAAESILARNFRSDRVYENVTGIHTLALEQTFRLGKLYVPMHLEGRYVQRVGGDSTLEAEGHASTTMGRVQVTGAMEWRQQRSGRGPDPPDTVDAAFLANGSIGKTRVRGELRWRLMPESRFKSADLVVERRIKEATLLRGELGYDSGYHRARAGVGYVRQFDKFALSLTGEVATDGSVAAGLNLAFSLGPNPRGGIRVTSNKIASNGSLLARVFRDENGDGIREPGEQVEKDVQIMVARAPIEKVTDDQGEVMVDNLVPHLPVMISVDPSSLPDPMVQPAGLGVAVTPRPGLPMIVDLPLVGAGEVMGTLIGKDNAPIEGVDIELVDDRGPAISTTRSDYDGYFLFESVPYGKYRLRMTKVSAAAIGMGQDLNLTAVLGRSAPSVNLGRVQAGQSGGMRIAGATGAAPAAPAVRLSYQDVLMEGPASSLVSSR